MAANGEANRVRTWELRLAFWSPESDGLQLVSETQGRYDSLNCEDLFMPTLPYLTAPGNLSKAFAAIQSAQTPDKVSQDFVKTILGIPGGSGDNMTTFLRRIGFVGSDGSPTELYKRYRNPETSGEAVADAMRDAYSEIFKRNDFAYKLTSDEIKGHVIEITGSAQDAKNVVWIVATFANMLEHADFDARGAAKVVDQKPEAPVADPNSSSQQRNASHGRDQELALNLGYTINLNLPG